MEEHCSKLSASPSLPLEQNAKILPKRDAWMNAWQPCQEVTAYWLKTLYFFLPLKLKATLKTKILPLACPQFFVSRTKHFCVSLHSSFNICKV
jgi:hypothetical protein